MRRIAPTERDLIDRSRRAAQELGFVEAGGTPVSVEVLAWGRGITSGG